MLTFDLRLKPQDQDNLSSLVTRGIFFLQKVLCNIKENILL